MTYDQIMQALENGFKVYWQYSAYNVFLDSGKLYAMCEYDSYMTPLAEAEYKECFKEA